MICKRKNKTYVNIRNEFISFSFFIENSTREDQYRIKSILYTLMIFVVVNIV